MRDSLILCALILFWGCDTPQLNRLCEEGDATPIDYTRFEFSDHLDSDCMGAIDLFTDYYTPGLTGFTEESWLMEDQDAYDSFNLMVQEAWQELKDENFSQSFDCDTIILPPVDFTQHALLFVEMTTTGCEPLDQNIEMVKCSETNTYQVLLEWPYRGGCEPLIIDHVFLLIPQLESGYTLEIQDEMP